MIIAIVNQKGGVGKTTTTLGLARSLAKKRPVLVVDIDPLAAATDELFTHMAQRPARTVADVLAGRCELAQALFATEDNIRLLPGSDDMEDVVTDLAADDTGILRLRTLLAGRQETILIDCPAGLNALTLSAVIAANLVIVATIPEKWAVKGARKVLAQVNDVREALGFAPQIVGVVATMVRPTILHRHWLVELAAQTDMPFLGSIPLRGGRNSHRQLAADYDNLVLTCGRLLTGQA
jgi:chromosome partitioning protein